MPTEEFNTLGTSVHVYRTLKPHIGYFHTTLQLHYSLVNCARELFKPSRLGESSSLQWKNIFRFCFFVSDIISGVGLGRFWLRLSSPGPQQQEGNTALKFLVETSLKSESFEPLIEFLTFLVQKLWQNNQNWVKKSFWVIFTQNCFFGHNFWTIKGSNDSDSSLVSKKTWV